MPNQAKGPRLYVRRQRGRAARFVILDAGREIRTGYSEGDREQAEKALADYIARKYRSPRGPSDPSQISIGRILEIYGNERAPAVASPATIGFHIDALADYWGDLPVAAIKGETCRGYVRSRTKPELEGRRPVKEATARRELETLGAALNYCHREGYLTSAPRVTVPAKAEPRTRWLSRSEAARLLWAAWRARARAPHLPIFILIGLYTGTRSGAILRLQWIPNTAGGWIDLERGILYRGAEARVETNKRQPACPLPAKLVAHLRRARRSSRQFVIEFNGERVCKLRRSWRSACDAAELGADVVPHCLRHTAVTWRLQAGVRIWDVAGYVGMSEKMVRETYGHHAPDHLQEARDAI